MAPPKTQQRTPSSQHTKSPSTSTPTPSRHRSTPSGTIRSTQDVQDIALTIWNNYIEKTPQRVKLLDAFMGFLVVVALLQFLYCILAGNYVRSPLHWTSCWACRGMLGRLVRPTADKYLYSLSTPSSLASQLRLANLCSQRACGYRRILRTRQNLNEYRTRGRSIHLSIGLATRELTFLDL